MSGRSAGASASLSSARPDRSRSTNCNGQWLGAIVAILTDPVTGERTGGITRTYIHRRPQDRQGEVARRRRPAGNHPPVARRRGGHRAAHLRGDRVGAVAHADGLLPDVGGRLDVAAGELPSPRRHRMPDDHRRSRPGRGGDASQRPRAKCANDGPTPAARAVMKIRKETGGGRQRHP